MYLRASKSWFQLAFGCVLSHFSNILLHLFSTSLGQSSQMISNTSEDIDSCTPRSFHLGATDCTTWLCRCIKEGRSVSTGTKTTDYTIKTVMCDAISLQKKEMFAGLISTVYFLLCIYSIKFRGMQFLLTTEFSSLKVTIMRIGSMLYNR